MKPSNTIAETRRKLGFTSQLKFANYLGVTRDSVARWENAVTPLPGPVARVIELLDEKAIVDGIRVRDADNKPPRKA